ncbi:hypothetical protein BKA61DRAFT_590752 [Leptodontidium sp. MPI-SDFR-AT-0119]|nr:hypothetical protein BKA61DRAFT_590752 [Leptodontidium sp. MPI-SDFR-AT-0119]
MMHVIVGRLFSYFQASTSLWFRAFILFCSGGPFEFRLGGWGSGIPLASESWHSRHRTARACPLPLFAMYVVKLGDWGWIQYL